MVKYMLLHNYCIPVLYLFLVPMDLWPCAVCWTLVVSVWLNLTSLTLTLRWGLWALYSPFKNFLLWHQLVFGRIWLPWPILSDEVCRCDIHFSFFYHTIQCLAEFDFPDPYSQVRAAGVAFPPFFFNSTSQRLTEFDFTDPYSQARTAGVQFTFCNVTSQCLDEFNLPDC